MKHSDSRLKGPRLKPLAAGLAMVFAVGVFTLPSDTGARCAKMAGGWRSWPSSLKLRRWSPNCVPSARRWSSPAQR